MNKNIIVKSRAEQSRALHLIVLFIFTIAIVGIIEILWLMHFGNTPEKYTDIVLEQLGSEFANKSIELKLYWFGMVIGIVILTVFLVFRKVDSKIDSIGTIKEDMFLLVGMMGTFFGEMLFYGYINNTLVLAFMMFLLGMRIENGSGKELVGIFLVALYAISGLYRLYIFFGGQHEIYFKSILVGAMLLCIMICLFRIDKYKAIIALQIPIPFVLLIYLVDDYVFQGGNYQIEQRKSVQIIILVVIILAFIELGVLIKKNWNLSDEMQIGTLNVVAIMAFNRFSGNGYIMLQDMHHPAENTIAYNQITNLGRVPFSEYIPISGLYSWIQGFFFQIFGDGKYTEYSNTNNVFYLVICVFTVLALKQHLKAIWTLLFGCCILVSDYSRVALILPFMLLLLSPHILKKKNVWYMLWVFLGWSYGLYYPAYGAAIIVALIPLGINQLPMVLEEWKTATRVKKYIIGLCWIVILGGIIVSAPLLIGMAKHVLAMGDGMIYVDGVTIFGQSLPSNFMDYLKVEGILYTVRLILGYVVRFTGPMMVVWVAFVSMLNIFGKRKFVKCRIYQWLFRINEEEASALACLIFPMICFYFSLYRMGPGNLFNRAVHIIDFSLIIVIILLFKYGKGVDSLIICGIAIFLCTMGNINALNAIDGKYYSCYHVPDDYTYVSFDVDSAPNLGNGFVKQEQLAQIENAASIYSKMDAERNYFALFSNGDHGMAYDSILNIKGAGMLESLVVRGYSISKDIAETLLDCDTIVGNRISPVDHYYLWKWLVTSGEYCWSEEESIFYPTAEYGENEVRALNANAIAGMATLDCGRYAASLGNSVDALSKVLKYQDVLYNFIKCDDNSINLEFVDPIDANDIDYIYVQLDAGLEYKSHIMGENHVATNKIENLLMKHEYNETKNVIVQWESNDGSINQLSSKIENGKLLIPIGAGVKWLCNDHSYIKIWCEDSGNVIPMPEIIDLKFYSVRDIEV